MLLARWHVTANWARVAHSSPHLQIDTLRLPTTMDAGYSPNDGHEPYSNAPTPALSRSNSTGSSSSFPDGIDLTAGEASWPLAGESEPHPSTGAGGIVTGLCSSADAIFVVISILFNA